MQIQTPHNAIYAQANAINAIDPPEGKSAYTLNFTSRYALAKCLAALQAAVAVLESARLKMAADYGLKNVQGPDGRQRLGGERYEEFDREFNVFLGKTTAVEYHQLKVQDLDLDKNQVPISLLAPLIGFVVVDEIAERPPVK